MTVKNSPYEHYYDNGTLQEKCTCKNGRLDGPYERYWDNGQLGQKCTFKNGELDGPYERYHKNGQLCVKCFYRDRTEVTEEEYNRLTQSESSPVKITTHSNPTKALHEKGENYR